ncbi:MAG: hypothetical protein GF347_05565 [Candidatus Moranbacteria bacterium]|nr:hypothetical protein [Candidatus Moranbacteria bacterium]
MNQKILPFNDNLIFFDSEFSSLNPYEGELLSVGMLKPNGEQLYFELEYDGPYSQWVKNNVLPSLEGPKITRKKAVKLIKNFIGKKKPHLFAYVPQFDMIYTHKLFVNEKWPFHPFAIDLASMLFTLGIDPNVLVNQNKDFFNSINIDLEKYNRHHALEDAILLRDIYLKLKK